MKDIQRAKPAAPGKICRPVYRLLTSRAHMLGPERRDLTMRIDSRPPVIPGAASQPRPANGSARFSLDQTPRSAAQGAAAASGLIGLDAVLALQGEPEQEERRRRRQAARRGYDLLDTLDSLKISLLSGRVPVDQIGRLKQQIETQGFPSGDPRLDELIAHIELRAGVELAKIAAAAAAARD